MRIGFIGLGAMGGRMARRLLDAGHEVVVHNRSRARADELVKAGATWANTPQAAAQGAEVVISMVRDDAASRAVWLGADGALSALTGVGLEMSTVTAEGAAALAEASDGRIVDAPVVGTTPQAEGGSLVVLLGGDAALAERLAPVLEPLSSAVHALGARGAGAVVKLAVNAFFGAQVAALAQLIGFVEKAGVPPADALDVLGTLPVTSPTLAFLGPRMLGDSFPAMFPIELVAKDFDCLASTAAAVGADVSALVAAGRAYHEAAAAGRGQDNIHGVVRGYR